MSDTGFVAWDVQALNDVGRCDEFLFCPFIPGDLPASRQVPGAKLSDPFRVFNRVLKTLSGCMQLIFDHLLHPYSFPDLNFQEVYTRSKFGQIDRMFTTILIRYSFVYHFP